VYFALVEWSSDICLRWVPVGREIESCHSTILRKYHFHYFY
jgi:hypothetical protein